MFLSEQLYPAIFEEFPLTSNGTSDEIQRETNRKGRKFRETTYEIFTKLGLTSTNNALEEKNTPKAVRGYKEDTKVQYQFLSSIGDKSQQLSKMKKANEELHEKLEELRDTHYSYR